MTGIKHGHMYTHAHTCTHIHTLAHKNTHYRLHTVCITAVPVYPILPTKHEHGAKKRRLRRQTAQQRKEEQRLAGQIKTLTCEPCSPHPSHIPSYFPAFPAAHTYQRTAVCSHARRFFFFSIPGPKHVRSSHVAQTHAHACGYTQFSCKI